MEAVMLALAWITVAMIGCSVLLMLTLIVAVLVEAFRR
jgi:hypothetical protein